MSLGNKKTYGQKGDNHPYQFNVLRALGNLITVSTPPPGGFASEATALNILSAITASNQDVEILLVRDTGNGDVVVKQIQEYVSGSISYEDVNGNPYTPTGPLVYLNPAAILNLVLTELQNQSTTLTSLDGKDYATETTLNNLLTAFNAEDFATQTTLAALLTAFNNEDFASQTTLAALLTAFSSTDFATETTLTAINTVINNIKTDTGNIALDTNVLATPITGLPVSLLRVSTAGASSVAAGKRRVSFANVGSSDAQVAGGMLAAGESVTFAAGNSRDTLAAITYDSLVSTLLISTVG